MRSPQTGLTLLEMMVVLLIAGMAMALGFQSLSQWRRADAAINEIQGATQQGALTEGWLRSSLRSLVPIDERQFSGTPDRLEGVCVSPVLSHQGGASDVEWKIETGADGVVLVLTEGDSLLELPLPDTVSASFGYVDGAGELHSQWPPRLGLPNHLPAAIVLVQRSASGHEQAWASAIAGSLNPVRKPFEFEDD